MEEKWEGGGIWGYERYVLNYLGEDNIKKKFHNLYLSNIAKMAHSAVNIPKPR